MVGRFDLLLAKLHLKNTFATLLLPITNYLYFIYLINSYLYYFITTFSEINSPTEEATAGHYLWHSVLLALDAVFHVRADRRTRVDVNDYYEAVGNRDRKLLALVNSSYNVMHLSMDYDGNSRKKVCDDGFVLANDIIVRCAKIIAS